MGGGAINPPRHPPQLRSGTELGKARAGGGEGCGLPGLPLVGVGVSESQRKPMIYYTAVPASGASCSGAAAAGQPAHTRTTHTHAASLTSPRPQVLADIPLAWGSRQAPGGPGPGGGGWEGRISLKSRRLPRPPHPGRPEREGKMQQQQRDPPGQAARGSRICISYVMHRKFPQSEPARSEAHDAGCRQPWGREQSGGVSPAAGDGGGGTAPQSLSRQRPKESNPFLNAPLWPEVPGRIAKLGGPDFRELWEVGECGVGNAL